MRNIHPQLLCCVVVVCLGNDGESSGTDGNDSGYSLHYDGVASKSDPSV